MSNRTKDCYSALFKYIEDNIFKLEPDEIITDFEAGMRGAINENFPNALLRGCWYHYCACLRKKFFSLGLGNLIKSCPDAKFIKKIFMSLPLLPPERFNEGLTYIKHLTDIFGLTRDFRPFFQYYQYWIDQVRLLYPPSFYYNGSIIV